MDHNKMDYLSLLHIITEVHLQAKINSRLNLKWWPTFWHVCDFVWWQNTMTMRFKHLISMKELHWGSLSPVVPLPPSPKYRNENHEAILRWIYRKLYVKSATRLGRPWRDARLKSRHRNLGNGSETIKIRETEVKRQSYGSQWKCAKKSWQFYCKFPCRLL